LLIHSTKCSLKCGIGHNLNIVMSFKYAEKFWIWWKVLWMGWLDEKLPLLWWEL